MAATGRCDRDFIARSNARELATAYRDFLRVRRETHRPVDPRNEVAWLVDPAGSRQLAGDGRSSMQRCRASVPARSLLRADSPGGCRKQIRADDRAAFERAFAHRVKGVPRAIEGIAGDVGFDFARFASAIVSRRSDSCRRTLSSRERRRGSLPDGQHRSAAESDDGDRSIGPHDFTSQIHRALYADEIEYSVHAAAIVQRAHGLYRVVAGEDDLVGSQRSRAFEFCGIDSTTITRDAEIALTI